MEENRDFFMLRSNFFYFPLSILSIALGIDTSIILWVYLIDILIWELLFIFFNCSSVYRLKSCVELTAVDLNCILIRFKLVILLLSICFNARFSLFSKSVEDTERSSLNNTYGSTNWLERELYDMYGLYFSGNFNFMRILCDYGFISFPLRKDFPCYGLVEVFFSEYKKRVIYLPVCLSILSQNV